MVEGFETIGNFFKKLFTCRRTVWASAFVASTLLARASFAIGGFAFSHEQKQFYSAMNQIAAIESRGSEITPDEVATLFESVWNYRGLEGLLDFDKHFLFFPTPHDGALSSFYLESLEVLSKAVLNKMNLPHNQTEVALPPALETYALSSREGLKKIRRDPRWFSYSNLFLTRIMQCGNPEVRTLAIYSTTRLAFYGLINKELLYTLMTVISSTRSEQLAFWESLSYTGRGGWRIMGDARYWLQKLTREQLDLISQWPNFGESMTHHYPSKTAALLDTEEVTIDLRRLTGQAQQVESHPKKSSALVVRAKSIGAFCRNLLSSQLIK